MGAAFLCSKEKKITNWHVKRSLRARGCRPLMYGMLVLSPRSRTGASTVTDHTQFQICVWDTLGVEVTKHQ